MAHLIKIYYENILGFIKSTDHLLTDRPTDRPTDPPTYRPTDPTITDPPIRSCLKDSAISFNLQNANTAGKMENYTSAYHLFE